MWDVVLETEITNVREPVSATLTESSEELNSNVVKDVSWQAADHATRARWVRHLRPF